MNDSSAKVICTTAIWIATAFIFGFGVFRFNYSGAFAGILWAGVSSLLAIAPAFATYAIWNSSSRPP